jgi:diguanylate cyclase (GGDEF)-like protein/PAS domain S-box-containing protein
MVQAEHRGPISLEKRAVALSGTRYAVVLVALAVAYYLAAKAGFLFAFETRQVSAIWPPTGIAFAAYAILGFRAWPGVLLGAFLANAWISPMSTAAGISVGNALAGIAGLHLARRIGGFRPGMSRVGDVVALVLLGGAAGSVVSATNGIANLLFAGILPWSNAASAWRVWWIGDTLGVVLVAPVLLTWVAPSSFAWSRARVAEAAGLLVGLAICGFLVFAAPVGAEGHGLTQLRYLAFPFLVWAGLRFGARETASTAIVLAAFATWGAVHDRGPFVTGTLDDRLVQLDVFLAVLGATALLIGAAITEGRIAERARESAVVRLHEAAHALRVADARYHRLFDSGMVGIVISDKETRVLEANDVFLAMVGYDRADVAAHRLTGVILNVPGEDEAQRAAQTQLDANGFTQPFEKELVRRDGTRVPVLIAVAILDPLLRINIVVDLSEQRRAEGLARVVDAARDAEAKFRELLEKAPIGVSILSREGRIIHVNRALARMFGYEDDPSSLVGRPGTELLHPDERGRVGPAAAAPIRGVVSSDSQPRPLRCLRRDGSTFFAEAIAVPATFAGELSTICVSRDVTASLAAEAARHAAEEEVLTQKALLEGVVESVDEGIIAVEPSRQTIAMNAAARTMVGKSFPRDHLPEDWRDHIRAVREDGSNMDPKDAPLARALRGEDCKGVVYRIVPADATKAGVGVWVSTSARAIRGAGGQVIAAVATLRDITEERATAEMLRSQSMTDELTGLLNRRGFLALANETLGEARGSKAPTAVLYADVNGLKRINDELGHAHGDQLLVDAARAFRRVFRDGDLVARLGGDEFAVLLPNVSPAAQDALLDRLADAIRAHDAEGRPYRLSLSYGITFMDWERGLSLDELLAEADQRMYERKRGRADQSEPYLRAQRELKD